MSRHVPRGFTYPLPKLGGGFSKGFRLREYSASVDEKEASSRGGRINARNWAPREEGDDFFPPRLYMGAPFILAFAKKKSCRIYFGAERSGSGREHSLGADDWWGDNRRSFSAATTAWCAEFCAVSWEGLGFEPTPGVWVEKKGVTLFKIRLSCACSG